MRSATGAFTMRGEARISKPVSAAGYVRSPREGKLARTRGRPRGRPNLGAVGHQQVSCSRMLLGLDPVSSCWEARLREGTLAADRPPASPDVGKLARTRAFTRTRARAGRYPATMDLPDVLALARSLMDEHGVGDWDLAWDRARRRAGSCDHGRRRITLSRHLMALYSQAEVRETVVHEIAHARVGTRHGHDAVWRAEARRLGGSGARLVAADAPRVPGRWAGVCPAGHEVSRIRRPTVPLSCSRCSRRFDLRHLMAWSRDGHPVAHQDIGERYAHVLARLRAAEG